MVASTTSRPSAAPIPEQPLDHLQAPGVKASYMGHPGDWELWFSAIDLGVPAVVLLEDVVADHPAEGAADEDVGGEVLLA
jgi:hypothetical protein